VATFEIGVRGVNLTIFKLVAKIVRAEAVEAIMAALQTVSAIAERVTFLYVVTCLAAPVAHLVVVFTPGVYGTITNGNLGPTSSLAFEVRGLVHVAIDVTTDTSDGIGGGESF